MNLLRTPLLILVLVDLPFLLVALGLTSWALSGYATALRYLNTDYGSSASDGGGYSSYYSSYYYPSYSYDYTTAGNGSSYTGYDSFLSSFYSAVRTSVLSYSLESYTTTLRDGSGSAFATLSNLVTAVPVETTYLPSASSLLRNGKRSATLAPPEALAWPTPAPALPTLPPAMAAPTATPTQAPRPERTPAQAPFVHRLVRRRRGGSSGLSSSSSSSSSSTSSSSSSSYDYVSPIRTLVALLAVILVAIVLRILGGIGFFVAVLSSKSSVRRQTSATRAFLFLTAFSTLLLLAFWLAFVIYTGVRYGPPRGADGAFLFFWIVCSLTGIAAVVLAARMPSSLAADDGMMDSDSDGKVHGMSNGHSHMAPLPFNGQVGAPMAAHQHNHPVSSQPHTAAASSSAVSSAPSPASPIAMPSPAPAPAPAPAMPRKQPQSSNGYMAPLPFNGQVGTPPAAHQHKALPVPSPSPAPAALEQAAPTVTAPTSHAPTPHALYQAVPDGRGGVTLQPYSPQ